LISLCSCSSIRCGAQRGTNERNMWEVALVVLAIGENEVW
jgi:hypothetical protein